MKAFVDKSGCISCELCVSICPEVFRMADDGFAEVYLEAIPESLEETVMEARDNCPTSVITAE